ncbi:MAG: transposase [Faecalibacterium sp.]|nr:transposase [Ruminococcus sp.]MCM1391316.1 transposase [Ruminococcus sp.]MCM1484870.1 transposase [Faecalibacterium sp.]
MAYIKRKSNRLVNYSYNSQGLYFVTICTQKKECILSEIVEHDATGIVDNQLMEYGKVVENQILEMNNKYNDIIAKQYVIMPNHIHVILEVQNTNNVKPTSSRANELIPRYISTLKRFCNAKIGFNIWQRSYHDHIIRNENDYQAISQYIDSNPIKWKEDRFYVLP